MLNTKSLLKSLDFLKKVFQTRLKLHFSKEEIKASEFKVPPIQLKDDGSPFAQFIIQTNLNFEEYIILLLALVPHFKPHFLSEIISKTIQEPGNYPELGGLKDSNNRGFLPTGETALFVIAGNDLAKRFEVQQIFSSEHWFHQQQVLQLQAVKEGEPKMNGQLILDHDYIEMFTIGRISRPTLSTKFPAQYITTDLTWEDLVLNEKTLAEILELNRWVQHNDTLLYDWGMASRIKPGYRALLHGPPGTGKTLTATLLGKSTKRDVFRIDLSMVVSKFIGETEKNLASLFDKAQNKNWILFFDEADALFGKRTNVRDAHDKYANQEVAYLLQRIEAYPGLVILASNFKSNIDEAFTRRFQSIIYFPIPNTQERLQLWEKAFPEKVDFAPDVDFKKIAKLYELSGSNIVNIVQFCSLKLLEKDTTILTNELIKEGIKRELQKEDKVIR